MGMELAKESGAVERAFGFSSGADGNCWDGVVCVAFCPEQGTANSATAERNNIQARVIEFIRQSPQESLTPFPHRGPCTPASTRLER